jgi:hypothetical protein
MRVALRLSAPALLLFALTAGLLAASHVRIVRLSLVVGAVQVKLPDGRGWRPALLNAPLVQDEAVRTLGSGRAEIQFENGSTLRLIPDSQVELTRLALSDRGVFETTARVSRGTAFATLRKLDSKDFRLLLAGDRWAQAKGDAALRVTAAAGARPVEVLSGRAEVYGGGRDLTLNKDQAAQFAAQGEARKVDVSAPADPWTKWSETRDQYYEAAFREGVQPGGLTSVVNWNADLSAPMPAYSGVGLNYVGTQACPWTMTQGAYAGWCWSSANGWYFPATPPAVGAQVAAAASDVSQTNSVLAGASASPYNVMFYGGPFGGMYGGALMYGSGIGVGAPMLCDMLCLDAYYGANAFLFSNFYGMDSAFYPAAMPAGGGASVSAGGRTAHGPDPRRPGTRQPFGTRPGTPSLASRAALGPPPAPRAAMGPRSRFGARGMGREAAAFQAGVQPSGIRMSHANFHTAFRAAGPTAAPSFDRAMAPPAAMQAAPPPGGFGGMSGAAGGSFRGGATMVGGAAHGGGGARVVH